MFRSEGGVHSALVATDEEIYSTLQNPINEVLATLNLPPFVFDARLIRKRLPRSEDMQRALMILKQSGQLADIASTWLYFPRLVEGRAIMGKDLILEIFNDLLAQPTRVNSKRMSLTMEVTTGNLLHFEADDMELMFEFIKTYWGNSDAILDKITPKTPRSE